MRWEWPPRVLVPQRTLHPTREGWWCLLVALALGLTAMNSGNNLLYLLDALVLALVIVSGIFSEHSLRGVRLVTRAPEEMFAGRPATVGATVTNGKRWLPARSIALETDDGHRLATVAWLAAGGERIVAWETSFPRRGRHRLPGMRLTTRFPFGLFVKAGRVQRDRDVIVFPALLAVDAARVPALLTAPARPVRRRGRGEDLHDLRDYRAGDDARLIHWRVSARTGALTLRELEAEATADVRLVLRGTGARDAERLERGLSEAASLALHAAARGAAVALAGAGLAVPAGRGREHLRRLLTVLALYEPAAAAAAPPRPARGDVVVDLD